MRKGNAPWMKQLAGMRFKAVMRELWHVEVFYRGDADVDDRKRTSEP